MRIPGVLKIFTFILSIFAFTLFTSFKKDQVYADEFLAFWKDVRENYAYFNKKHTDWDKVRSVYLPLAENARDRNGLITIFEQAIEELYDHHFSLNTNLPSSPRLVPTGIDVWAEWIEGKAMVTEVRKDFSAESAGVKAGIEILAINDEPVREAVNNRRGKCIFPTDIEADNYALRQLLAGNYITQRSIKVRYKGNTSTIMPDKDAGNITDSQSYASLLEFKKIKNNTGYIRFNNSLGQTDVIAAFDSALNQLRNTPALIIDLRETPSGGNSNVARAILSRFITREQPYQKHLLPNEELETGIRRSWVELVSPRGEFTYRNPVIVLVDHWTGSMGEGIAIGFTSTHAATVVGTRMAGLNGSINEFETPVLKIPYSFPTEQLFTVSGQPREDFIPAILVDPATTIFENSTDPLLEEALQVLYSFR